MWHARFDITCDPWVPGYNHAIWANVSEAAPSKPKCTCWSKPCKSCCPEVILGANALHMLLLGDFGYYYIKHRAQCKNDRWHNVTERAA